MAVEYSTMEVRWKIYHMGSQMEDSIMEFRRNTLPWKSHGQLKDESQTEHVTMDVRWKALRWKSDGTLYRLRSHVRRACSRLYVISVRQPVLPASEAAHEGGHVRAVQDGDGQGHSLRNGKHQVRSACVINPFRPLVTLAAFSSSARKRELLP